MGLYSCQPTIFTPPRRPVSPAIANQRKLDLRNEKARGVWTIFPFGAIMRQTLLPGWKMIFFIAHFWQWYHIHVLLVSVTCAVHYHYFEILDTATIKRPSRPMPLCLSTWTNLIHPSIALCMYLIKLQSFRLTDRDCAVYLFRSSAHDWAVLHGLNPLVCISDSWRKRHTFEK